MKILQQVKRLMFMTVLMTTVLFAELPLELQSLVRHCKTRNLLGQLYDHHMLGETDLRIMIKKHLEPLKALKVKAAATTDEQQPELTQEAKAQMKELALTGLKLDLNLALGKVTPAQTPKWLNIDVVNEFSMKVTRIQEAQELVSNNAGKIKMAALVTTLIAALVAYMNKEVLQDKLGSWFGDVAQKASDRYFKKNTDFSEAVNTTVKKTLENPENLKALQNGLHTVVTNPETKEVLNEVAGDMGSAVLNHPETKKALDARTEELEERMNALVDKKSLELEARFSAAADAQRAAIQTDVYGLKHQFIDVLADMKVFGTHVLAPDKVAALKAKPMGVIAPAVIVPVPDVVQATTPEGLQNSELEVTVPVEESSQTATATPALVVEKKSVWYKPWTWGK